MRLASFLELTIKYVAFDSAILPPTTSSELGRTHTAKTNKVEAILTDMMPVI
jgi:hypothetical protein